MTDQATDPTTDPAEPDPTDPNDQPVEPADNGGDNERANRQAARYRTERNELQTQLAAAQQAQTDLVARLTAALGGNPDPAEDPAAQVQTLTSQVESLTAEAGALRAELAVHDLAVENGGNPQALLDSRSFLTTLQALDASADDYREQVASAIKDAVSKNANLRSKGQGPARGGAPGAGQGPANPDGAVTQEQFNAMSYKDRADLYRTNPDLYQRLAGN